MLILLYGRTSQSHFNRSSAKTTFFSSWVCFSLSLTWRKRRMARSRSRHSPVMSVGVNTYYDGAAMPRWRERGRERGSRRSTRQPGRREIEGHIFTRRAISGTPDQGRRCCLCAYEHRCILSLMHVCVCVCVYVLCNDLGRCCCCCYRKGGWNK